MKIARLSSTCAINTVAEKFLKGFQGYLQTDAYKGYTQVTAHEGVTSVGCWARARRKFEDVVNLGDKHGKAAEAVAIMQRRREYPCKIAVFVGVWEHVSCMTRRAELLPIF